MGHFVDIVLAYFRVEEDALENQLRAYQMQKGEQIDVFLGRLKEICNQLTSIGAMPDEELMVRIALNIVFEDREVFVQSILGRMKLPD